MPTNSTVGRPKQQLTLFDALSIIIGIVIGAGIYETTPLIAKSLGTTRLVDRHLGSRRYHFSD